MKMIDKCRSILITFDLIGLSPQLYMFSNKRYKSFFSSIISILIILFSIIFAIYSLFDYLKYQSPIVAFSKDSDIETKRELVLKDIFLMFQIVDSSTLNYVDDSVAYLKAQFTEIYDNGNISGIPLEIERCEVGKNINIKFKKMIEDKYKFERTVEDFYCLKPKDNISIYFYPNVAYSFIEINIIIKNNSKYIPEKLQAMIVSENDLINHYNKDNPITNFFIYQILTSFSSSEYTKIYYDYQYIKYESDDGLFYKNSKTLSGMSFSGMTFYKGIQDDYNLQRDFQNSSESNIGNIKLEINKTHFDNYNRSYKKLQSLLAEVTSVVSLLFEIGRQISSFLCEKKMSTDIVYDLLNQDKKYIPIKLTHIKNLTKNNQKKNSEFSSDRKKINPELMNKDNYNDNTREEKNEIIKLDKSRENLRIKKDSNEEKNINNKFMKKINYFYILKSYFCFKDNKSKLIELCHKLVIEDMSVERILQRFYNLERIYYSFLKEEKGKIKLIKIKRFNEINKCIMDINNEIYNSKNKKESENNKENT